MNLFLLLFSYFLLSFVCTGMPTFRFPSFNPSKFTLVVTLEVFSVLLPLKLDGFLTASYWVVFVPLWVLAAVVLVGGIIGIAARIRRKRMNGGGGPEAGAGAGAGAGGELGLDEGGRKEFTQMVFIFIQYVLLLCFGILVCHNLEAPAPSPLILNWGAVFFPLLLVSFISCFTYFYWKLFQRPATVHPTPSLSPLSLSPLSSLPLSSLPLSLSSLISMWLVRGAACLGDSLLLIS